MLNCNDGNIFRVTAAPQHSSRRREEYTNHGLESPMHDHHRSTKVLTLSCPEPRTYVKPQSEDHRSAVAVFGRDMYHFLTHFGISLILFVRKNFLDQEEMSVHAERRERNTKSRKKGGLTRRQ